ncbi:hypothetical protein [Algoriphagus sp.]|uniref:hypothetical protein n=1 Tax=Algoriphagus sp. TaxID=1872435 RepID=UPI00329A7AB1
MWRNFGHRYAASPEAASKIIVLLLEKQDNKKMKRLLRSFVTRNDGTRSRIT